MKKLLLNPFEKFTELQMLLAGLLLFIAGNLGAYNFGARFDGALDLHFTGHVTLLQPFVDNAINTIALLLCLYITGCIINQKTRVVDVLVAVLISRVPFYLLPAFNTNKYLEDITNGLIISGFESVSTPDITYILLFALVTIGALALLLVLLYNGFKTAANLKSTTHKTLFAVGILAAEAISKLLIGYINY